MQTDSRDRIVVSTLRCGRNNPGSNPGHGIYSVFAEKMPALGKSLKSTVRIDNPLFQIAIFIYFFPLDKENPNTFFLLCPALENNRVQVGGLNLRSSFLWRWGISLNMIRK